jgi:hypothetical protein
MFVLSCFFLSFTVKFMYTSSQASVTLVLEVPAPPPPPHAALHRAPSSRPEKCACCLSTSRNVPAISASGPERNRTVPKLVKQTRNFQKKYRFYKHWVAGSEKQLIVKCFKRVQISQWLWIWKEWAVTDRRQETRRTILRRRREHLYPDNQDYDLWSDRH